LSSLKAGESTPIGQRLRRQMDWEAEVVAALTRWQIQTGLRLCPPTAEEVADAAKPQADFNALSASSPDVAMSSRLFRVYPFRDDADRMMKQYNTALFYGALSPIQRDALVNQRLQFSSLTIPLQEMAVSLSPQS